MMVSFSTLSSASFIANDDDWVAFAFSGTAADTVKLLSILSRLCRDDDMDVDVPLSRRATHIVTIVNVGMNLSFIFHEMMMIYSI